MKTCIFCKSDLAIKGRSKEHILPRWLQEEWKLSDHSIEPTHFGEDGEVRSSRKQVLDSFLSGNVCTECNNGWMSQLEVANKETIVKLATDKRRILDLSDAEALLLARWAVKTAFALHASANWRRVVPDEHYAVLDQDDYRLPPGVFVVGHTYKCSRSFSWAQSTTWPIYYRGVEVSSSEVEHVRKSGYKIGLRIGGLFLLVFHVSLKDARACLWKFKHVPLYPRWSHPVAWQLSEKPWPKNVYTRFHFFHQSLALSVDGLEQV